NKGKYTYKKRSFNEKMKDASKKKRLNQISNTEKISSSSSTENNRESLTNKLEKLFNFPLDSFISKELSEKNTCNIKKNYYEEPSERNNAEKTYSEESSEKSSEINNAQKTYFQESNEINNNQKTYSEENKEIHQIKFPLTGYVFNEWQSTENPFIPSKMIDGEKSTEKLVDSMLMGMLSIENIENPLTLINGGQSSRKLVNLDSESLNFESLMSLIT
ncbi:21412_t:CDS:2, partial [Racocetra persica]